MSGTDDKELTTAAVQEMLAEAERCAAMPVSQFARIDHDGYDDGRVETLRDIALPIAKERDAAVAALSVLAEFARTAPGRLPERVTRALRVSDWARGVPCPTCNDTRVMEHPQGVKRPCVECVADADAKALTTAQIRALKPYPVGWHTALLIAEERDRLADINARLSHTLRTVDAAHRANMGRAEAAEREADRFRHGAPVEGDFVCPNALEVDRLRADAESASVRMAAESARANKAERDAEEMRAALRLIGRHLNAPSSTTDRDAMSAYALARQLDEEASHG